MNEIVSKSLKLLLVMIFIVVLVYFVKTELLVEKEGFNNNDKITWNLDFDTIGLSTNKWVVKINQENHDVTKQYYPGKITTSLDEDKLKIMTVDSNSEDASALPKNLYVELTTDLENWKGTNGDKSNFEFKDNYQYVLTPPQVHRSGETTSTSDMNTVKIIDEEAGTVSQEDGFVSMTRTKFLLGDADSARLTLRLRISNGEVIHVNPFLIEKESCNSSCTKVGCTGNAKQFLQSDNTYVDFYPARSTSDNVYDSNCQGGCIYSKAYRGVNNGTKSNGDPTDTITRFVMNNIDGTTSIKEFSNTTAEDACDAIGDIWENTWNPKSSTSASEVDTTKTTTLPRENGTEDVNNQDTLNNQWQSYFGENAFIDGENPTTLSGSGTSTDSSKYPFAGSPPMRVVGDFTIDTTVDPHQYSFDINLSDGKSKESNTEEEQEEEQEKEITRGQEGRYDNRYDNSESAKRQAVRRQTFGKKTADVFGENARGTTKPMAYPWAAGEKQYLDSASKRLESVQTGVFYPYNSVMNLF